MIRFLPSFALCLTVSTALAQVPCYDSNLGTQLTLADDAFSPPLPLGFTLNYGGVAYTDVQVCSNGYIVFGSGAPGAADYTPSVAELTGNPEPRICPIWRDMNPTSAGSGQVWYNAVPASASNPAYFSVTYDGVHQYGSTTPQSCQIVFIDGDSIQIHHGNDLVNGTNPWLVGASPGNGATANPVAFSGLPTPVVSSSDTLHEDGPNGFPFPGSTMAWTATAPGYVVTSAGGCAAKSEYGAGCVAQFGSFYEHFTTTPSFDLSNTAITGLFTGTEYVITQGTTTFMAPSANATNLNLGDDTVGTVTLSAPLAYPGGSTSTLEVCSNGFIGTTNNGASYQPIPTTMLNWIGPIWAVWHDFIPNATGNVWFEEIGGVAYITWDNVIGYVGTTAGVTPSTFQFQFDTNTGFFHVVFQSMDTISISGWANGDGYVVGFTAGNGAGDPGSIDLTPVATSSATIQTGADIFPLALDVDALPVVNTTINFVATNITPTAPIGGLLYGVTKFDPGLSLASVGMPGCFQYNDQVAVTLFFPASATSVSVPLNVPNLVGAIVQVQVAVYDPASAANGLATASNGLEIVVGN